MSSSSPIAPKLLLTPPEAADALSLCEKTLWSMTYPRGDLRSTRIGRAVRYSVSELERWIAAREQEGAHDER